MTIIEVLNFASHKKWERIIIFSDSRFVLTSIQSIFDTNQGSELILQIKFILLQMEKSDRKVKFIYIPNYIDITGNEMADQFAKKAIKEGKDDQILISIKEFKTLWKK